MGEYTYMSPTLIHTEALAHQKQLTVLMIIFTKKMVIFQYQEVTLSREIDDFMYGDGRAQDETMVHLNRTKSKRKIILWLKLEKMTNRTNDDIAPESQV